MRLFATLPLLALSLALPAVSLAQTAPDAPKKDQTASGRAHEASTADAIDKGWAQAPVEEVEKISSHSITAQGRTIAYKATAGTLTIRNDEGKPTASVFYVAYTQDGSKPGTRRPITFLYNGGPGSASLWLHMGSFGPMRVQTANPEYIKPAPYAFGPNPDTLLDKTDLVFIDAVGSGYSRPLGEAKGKDFYGVDQDADAFARAIIRYVTKNSRWNSPKYIFGESYGTTRSGALAYQLQDRGVALNGVIILSSILNYGVRQPGFDQIYLTYLPSYAATAWYHNRIPNKPADISAFLAEVRAYAAGPYAAALAKGHNLSDAERDAVAQQVSAYTGLSVDFLKRSNLRVDLNRFRKELLRDQRLTVGRYDSRYTGVDSDAAGEGADYDASDTSISGAFIATLSDYLANGLGYKTDLPYLPSARTEGWRWDFTHRAPGSRQPQSTPDVAIDLSAAMRTNPYLKVLSLNGWYDMATPFFGTEYDLSHMMLEPGERRNVEFRYYPSGHMAYLNPDALHMLHRDLAAFYDETSGATATVQPLPKGE
jgi:carboxypeptidase C (cathepsin A)